MWQWREFVISWQEGVSRRNLLLRSYLPYPFAFPNPRYPHPRQRPVTLRSNSNPRRKHICRGERVLGIVKLRDLKPRKRTHSRTDTACRGSIVVTFRKLQALSFRSPSSSPPPMLRLFYLSVRREVCSFSPFALKSFS